jgi:hyperosmotically inducible periplasmic protein
VKIRYKQMPISLTGKSLLIVLFSAVLGLAGCEREGTAEKAGQKIDQAVERAGEKLEGTRESLDEKADRTGDYMDDSAITAKIKAEIVSDPLLKVTQISVTTTNGVVMLSGVVDSQRSIDRVMEIVRSNPKVKSVENGLVLKGLN